MCSVQTGLDAGYMLIICNADKNSVSENVWMTLSKALSSFSLEFLWCPNFILKLNAYSLNIEYKRYCLNNFIKYLL